MNRLAAALCAISLWACTATDTLCQPVEGEPRLAVDPQTGKMFTTGTVNVDLGSALFRGCPAGSATLPSLADVKAFDPQGNAVAARAVVAEDHTYTIEVTAQEPGWYEVDVGLFPSYGAHRMHVLVARELAPEPEQIAMPCPTFFRAQNGLTVCGGWVPSSTTSDVLLGGGKFAALHGNTFWAVMGEYEKRIARYTAFSATELDQISQASFWEQAQDVRDFPIAATKGDALFRNGTQLLHAQADAQGMVQLVGARELGAGSAIFWDGQLALVDLAASRTYQVLRVNAGGGIDLVGEARPAADVLGVNEDGVWQRAGNRIELVRPDSTGPVTVGAFEVPPELTVYATTTRTAPIVYPAGFPPRTEGVGAAILAMGPNGLELQHATGATWITGANRGGGWFNQGNPLATLVFHANVNP